MTSNFNLPSLDEVRAAFLPEEHDGDRAHQLAVRIADEVVPRYRSGRPLSCAGIVAKRWSAAYEAAKLGIVTGRQQIETTTKRRVVYDNVNRRAWDALEMATEALSDANHVAALV